MKIEIIQQAWGGVVAKIDNKYIKNYRTCPISIATFSDNQEALDYIRNNYKDEEVK